MKRITRIAIAASLTVSCLGVSVWAAGLPRTDSKKIVLHYDFARGDSGWRAGFADYTKGQESTFELTSGIRPMPKELSRTQAKAFFLQGHNRSDDLVMFLSRRLSRADGIKPGQQYSLRYSIALASDAESDCAGIGGKPGESVYLKVGGASIAPKAVPISENPSFLRLNVPIGEQSEGGKAATVIGNIANGNPCSEGPPHFRSFHREGMHRGVVQADANGNLYLFIGTDSGFEGRTRLYYQRIQVTLTPVSGQAG